MFSSSVRAAMNSTIGASHSSACLTRSLFVRKRGSAIMSSRPMARNSRSDIAWIEAEMPI
jgi:hypothetical protein